MPLTCRVEAATRLVLATGHGVLSDDCLRSYVLSVLGDPALQPGFGELIDVTRITRVEVTTAGVAGLRGAMEVGGRFPVARSALVYSEDNRGEVSALFDLLEQGMPQRIRMFGDVDAARDWLTGQSTEARSTRGRARESRVAPRRPMVAEVEVRLEDDRRAGRLVNLSISGTLLHCDTPHPAPGSVVTLKIDPEGLPSFELTGTVVRHTDVGFAVRFREITPELLQLVGDPF